MSEHYRTFSAVFPVILRHEGEIAEILLHCRQNTGYQDGKWDIAGSGHVDEGESATIAAARECREELGIDVPPGDLSFIHLSHRITADRAYYDIYFTVRQYGGAPSVMEPDKCSALAWFPLDALPDDMIPCRREAVMGYLAGTAYSERLEQ